MKLGRITTVIAAYAAIWLSTELIGAPQVEGEAMRRLIAANGGLPPSTASFEEWAALDASEMDDMTKDPYPKYHAKAHSPAPFVVTVDEATTNGLLAGHGGRSVFLWMFGLSWRLSHKATWIS